MGSSGTGIWGEVDCRDAGAWVVSGTIVGMRVYADVIQMSILGVTDMNLHTLTGSNHLRHVNSLSDLKKSAAFQFYWNLYIQLHVSSWIQN